MALSGRDRRTLREIEQALVLSDPALADMLTSARHRGVRLARAVTGALVAVTVLLILAGLVLPDGGMITGGWLVLLTTPPTVCLIAAVERRER